MSLYDDVDREALHDWLNVRQALAADERPDPSEYEDRPAPSDDDDATDLTPTNQKGPRS